MFNGRQLYFHDRRSFCYLFTLQLPRRSAQGLSPAVLSRVRPGHSLDRGEHRPDGLTTNNQQLHHAGLQLTPLHRGLPDLEPEEPD